MDVPLECNLALVTDLHDYALVSILVLMDVPLEYNTNRLSVTSYLVSILVLMDVPLEF